MSLAGFAEGSRDEDAEAATAVDVGRHSEAAAVADEVGLEMQVTLFALRVVEVAQP